MFMAPNETRLENLDLSGFRFGALIYFCPRCDFQAPFTPSARAECFKCEATLVLTTVTADLMRITRAA
jgi:hypothetical protein